MGESVQVPRCFQRSHVWGLHALHISVAAVSEVEAEDRVGTSVPRPACNITIAIGVIAQHGTRIHRKEQSSISLVCKLTAIELFIVG